MTASNTPLGQKSGSPQALLFKTSMGGGRRKPLLLTIVEDSSFCRGSGVGTVCMTLSLMRARRKSRQAQTCDWINLPRQKHRELASATCRALPRVDHRLNCEEEPRIRRKNPSAGCMSMCGKVRHGLRALPPAQRWLRDSLIQRARPHRQFCLGKKPKPRRGNMHEVIPKLLYIQFLPA